MADEINVQLGATLQVLVSAGSMPFSVHDAPLPGFVVDREFGGFGRIWGTTKFKDSPEATPVPVKARVVLMRQRDKLVARETWSDPVTGEFEFRFIDARQQWLTLAEDAAGNYRPVAANKLVAEVPA